MNSQHSAIFHKKCACAHTHTSGERASRRRCLHGARGPLSPCVGSAMIRARCGCGCECGRGGYCGRRDSRGSAAAAAAIAATACRIERRDAVGSNHARLRRLMKRRRLNVSLCLDLGLGLELGLGLRKKRQ